MTYAAEYIIKKRKEKWYTDYNSDRDKILREAIANELLTNKDMLQEVQKHPEKLIEMLFVIVDKNKKTTPFFLNEVQEDFINKLNQTVRDYKDNKITTISILILKRKTTADSQHL